jgi:predicted permease
VFVVAEMAMALVLLIAAGLTIRSLSALWNVDPGFEPRNILTFGVSLAPSMKDASPDGLRAAFREVDSRLKTVPEVKAVSLSWGAMPLSYDDEDLFWLEGQPKPAAENEMNWALSYVVEEDFLKVMNIPLKRGRFFTAQDNEHAQHVIVIDEIFARKFFPNQDPIGKRIHLDNKGGLAEIVGIVGHINQWGLDRDDKRPLRAQLYFPFMQLPDKAIQSSWSGQGVVVRFEGDAQAAQTAIRSTLKSMNSDQVMYGEQTMESIIADSLVSRKSTMIVLGIFAALALGLASMGIYGVISYLVGQRTHEIGIRMALGAKPSQVLRAVLGEGLKMTVVGVAIGLIAAVGLTRLMANLLFGVSATDPLTFVAVAALLIFVALAACYIPARRAMRVDPIVALRYE